MTVRIAVLDDYQGVAATSADWSSIPDAELTTLRDHVDDEATIAERLRGSQIVIAMRERTPFPASLFPRLPDLRLLVTTGSRNQSIDLAAAHAMGVVVSATETHAAARWPAAELAWGLVLGLARQIPSEEAFLRSGGWQRAVGMGLAGRTLGVIGLGRLGTKVAGYGRAFGMRVIAWSANLSAEVATERGAELVTKDELLRTADVVSIHLVLGARSRGLIGDRELRSMRPTGFLVNTSRGPIVDEAALVRALNEGWIAGAGLDVYDREPLPLDSPLRSAPRTILTPHLGYVTEDGYRGYFTGAVESIRAFIAGEPIRVLTP